MISLLSPVYLSIDFAMLGSRRLQLLNIAASLALAWLFAGWPACASAAAAAGKAQKDRHEPPQETGFLNRSIEIHGASYRFQVYLPEDWRRDDGRLWPILLFLHGRGERGSEGMWQTQIGLPEAVRDHPERWPFVIVMPQCQQALHWTDAPMMELAMAALDRETAEFHGDPERTYLTGLSLGGYGAWELARLHPHRWAAVAIAAGGVFWSYAPERWQQANTLPAEYARALGRTPVWLFHGTDDPVVAPRQSELMFEAFKTAGGRIRLWLYQGLKHDCWTRAYNEPELPRWLLENRLESNRVEDRRVESRRAEETAAARSGRGAEKEQEPPPVAERMVIPLHPPAIRLNPAQIDSLTGEYLDASGIVVLTIFRQGEQLYAKDRYGQVSELAAQSPTELYYPGGYSTTRLIAERGAEGRIAAILLRDDRHEERWEKKPPAPSHSASAFAR